MKAKHPSPEGNPMSKSHRGGARGGMLVSLLQLKLKKAEQADGRMVVMGMVVSKTLPPSRSGEGQ